MPSAIINTRVQKNNTTEGIKAFSREFSNADKEFGAVIGRNGEAWGLVSGQAHSVSIDSAGMTKHMGRNGQVNVTHNHPSGGSFSTQDLKVWVFSRHVASISAVGRGTYTYKVTKKSNFNGEGFLKAFNKTMGGINDFDTWNKSMNSFMRSNSKKFGFEYSRTKTVKPRQNNTWDKISQKK